METKQGLIYGGIAVAGVGAGFGLGYILAKKKYAKIAEEEIESVRYAYAKNAQKKPDLVPKRENYIPTEADVETQNGVIAAEGYIPLDETDDAELFLRTHGRAPTTYELIQMGKGISPEQAVRTKDDTDDSVLVEGNIFDGAHEPDPEDLPDEEEAEIPVTLDRPHVITSEEWYLNETDYSQFSITWWADDGVLADPADVPILDYDRVVGSANLHRFGFKSNDPDIVYVRNHDLKADYEITKTEKNYAETIHGQNPDDDSSNESPRRMRSNDN